MFFTLDFAAVLNMNNRFVIQKPDETFMLVSEEDISDDMIYPDVDMNWMV